MLSSNVSEGTDNLPAPSSQAGHAGRSRSRTLGGMAITAALCDLGPGEFLGEIDVLLAIYADAMDADATLLPGRRELMRRHAGYPDFKALQMRTQCYPLDDPRAVLGFSYSFPGGSPPYAVMGAVFFFTVPLPQATTPFPYTPLSAQPEHKSGYTSAD